jgi:hypothetical protein
MQPITIGTKASASVQVTEAQLAVTVGSGYSQHQCWQH